MFVVPYFMGEPIDLPGPPGSVAITPQLPEGTPQERMAVLYRAVADHVSGEALPVVYSGDCVVVLGVVAGLQRRGIDATLLFFDAHGDFHTWETTQSGFIGGMPLAMVTGRGEQTILTGAGARPLPDSQVVLVDGRDLDPGEDVAVAEAGIDHVGVGDLAHRLPPEGPLYVHIDVDVVDPVDMPAVNYPAPGGPTLAAVRQALIHLEVTGRVAAVSVSTWNPALPEAERAAAATEELIAPLIYQG